MKKGIFSTIGFLLFITGGTALVLSLVGVKLAFLTWIDAGGALLGFLIRLGMLIGGIVIAALANTDWRNEEEV
jgi:hypothetical protein